MEVMVLFFCLDALKDMLWKRIYYVLNVKEKIIHLLLMAIVRNARVTLKNTLII